MPCQNRWLGSISAPTWVALDLGRPAAPSSPGCRRGCAGASRCTTLTSACGRPRLDVLPERDARPRSTGSRGRRGRRCPRAGRSRPAWSPPALGAGQAGHGDHPLARRAAAASSIASRMSLACFAPHRGVRVSGLPLQFRAVSVTPAALNSPRYSCAGVLAGAQVVDRQVRRGQEAAGVDLGAVQAEIARIAQGLARAACRAGRRCRRRASWVLLARGSVRGSGGSSEGSGPVDLGAAVGGGPVTAASSRRSRRPSSKDGTGGRPPRPGDLLEERPRLEDEQVVLAVADARGSPSAGRR